jgi:hypothetical protein
MLSRACSLTKPSRILKSQRGFLSLSRPSLTWIERYSFPYEAEPVVAQYKPYVVKCERGVVYNFCSCGHSQTQPWIDGQCLCSKKEGGHRPLSYIPSFTGYKLLCGCKHCSYKPEFDGTCFLKYIEDYPINGAVMTFAVWFSFATVIGYYFHP